VIEFLNSIILGNCLDVMTQIPNKSVNMILCDLPYGTTECSWDTIIPFVPLWAQYERIITDDGAIVLTASQPFTSALIMSNIKMFKYCWVWRKSCGAGFLNAKNAPIKMHEDICVFSKGATANGSKRNMAYYPQDLTPVERYRNRTGEHSNAVGTRPSRQKGYTQKFTGYPVSILYYPNDRNMMHDTTKPVALFEYLIKTYTNEGDTVLDNCIGSGTTALACINTGRKFIGIDILQEWVDASKARINELEISNMLG